MNAATLLMNESGAKGMTLQEVARAVDLNTTSVTYYFQRKEQLAAAVLEQSMARLDAMVLEASAAPNPQRRVESLLTLVVNLRAQVVRGAAQPLASLAEMRTLDDAIRKPLINQYLALFRHVRALFGPTPDEAHKALHTARAHVLLEAVFWLPFWISQYALDDYPNVARRLTDFFTHGIARSDRAWAPQLIQREALDGGGESGAASFLRVATQLINDAGYRGASVERIVAKLNVTKGSFYHHLDAKDDLVLACFRKSFERVGTLHRLAHEAGGDGWQRLSTIIATLLDVQLDGDWPLQRTSALRAMPLPLREEVMSQSHQLALRLAGELTDGMADGSIRIVDPAIASLMIMAAINVAYDLRGWSDGMVRKVAIDLYASTIVDGLFNDRVLEASTLSAVRKPSAQRAQRRGAFSPES